MNKSSTLPSGLFLAAAVAGAVALSASASEPEQYEACYGVAKAGHNDCKSSAHICAGKSAIDRDPRSFVDLPKGTCEKISGGALSEPAEKR